MDPEKKNDTWSDLQALKLKQNRFKEKRQRRKKELEEIVSGISSSSSHTLHHPTSSTSQISSSSSSTNLPHHLHSFASTVTNPQTLESHRDTGHHNEASATSTMNAEEVENKLLSCLCDAALKLPVDSRCLLAAIRKFITLEKSDHLMIVNLLEKFAHQGLITTINDSFTSDGEACIIVSSADHSKLIQFAQEVVSADAPDRTDLEESSSGLASSNFKRVISERSLSEKPSKSIKLSADSRENENGIEVEVNLESLLSLESTKEKESKKMGEELLQLLSRRRRHEGRR